MSNSIYEALKNLSAEEAKSRKIASCESNSIFLVVLLFAFVLMIILPIIFIWLAKLTDIEAYKYMGLLFLGVGYLLLVLHPIITFYKNRSSLIEFLKNPLGSVIDDINHKHNIDSSYLKTLESKSTNELKLIHLELCAEKEAFTKRVSLIIGAIDKIGLLPGVVALIISLYKVGDTENNNLAFAIAYATPVLYFMGAYAHILITQLSRYIKLMEFTINKKEERE